ncbi:MAG: hypothetical protein QOG15_424 [Solirubrobacteraceae bacterium]|jgi:hypothetical protein|nr:hypothetical protein [Solirubrobacteraceae bacterium]
MPRPGRRPFLSLAIAAVAALALPAAAQADAFTISPGGGTCAAGGDTVCGSFADAATAANANAGVDTFSVAAGSYTGDATFTTSVAITGVPGVLAQGSLVFNSADVTQTTLSGVAVFSSGASAAIRSTSAAGIAISDVTAVSASGNGVELTTATNSIQRANIITGNGSKSAVRVAPTGTDTATLNISSSFATGGLAGLGAFASGTVLGGSTATINAHHVTAAGSTHGVYADTSGAILCCAATITVTDSIVFSPGTNPGTLTSTTLNIDSATITDGDKNVLFAAPLAQNFRLKPGSPAIGAGGAPVSGESTTDVDGQDRSAAPTDLGADEYVNTPPTAVIKVATQLPRDGQPVTFDGSGSQDQPGGGIASYNWTFGDGTSARTTTPTVTHTYTGEGPVTAKLAVIDGEGAVSNVASTDVNILDGGAPTVKISKPANNQKFFVFVRKTKTVIKNGKKTKIKVKTKQRTRIKFAGTATDKSGVARVFITVQRVTGSGASGVVTGSATSSKCRWLDPKKGLKLTSCARPIVINVKLKADGTWNYNVKKSIKLSKGTYRVIAYGLDKTGSLGNSATKAQRNHKFKLK